MNNRLILVEGIPGVGKTTAATSIKQYLDDNNIQSKLYLEGNLEHPADYESVAYLNKEKYIYLLKKYKINEEKIKEYINKEDGNYFINYGMIRNDKIFKNSKEFLEELMTYDIYNLSIEKYSALTKNKWQKFIKKSQNNDCVYIFECCFLQNPITTMLAYHNMPNEYIKDHIKGIAEIIEPLNPLLIFSDTKDVKDNFDCVKKNRSIEWYNFVEDYVTNQTYGKENSLEGYDGLIAFYRHLKEVALESYEALDFEKIKLDSSKTQWKINAKKTETFLNNYLK